MRAAKLIVNPAAGRGRAAQLLPAIRSCLQSHGIETEVAQTRAPGEAADLAQRAKQDGFDLVIGVGGDGTLHETVNGLVRAAGDGVAGSLGIIPVGSGNDWAFNLSVPLDWRAACERIAGGQSRRVDVGMVNGEAVTNSLGIGFEAQVSLEARQIRWARGAIIYFGALAATLLRSYRTPQLTLTADGETTQEHITNLTLGNGRRSGASFYFVPEADLSDGLFDLCIAAAMGRAAIVSLVPRLMRGTHINDSRVRMRRARRVTITSDEPFPVHIDGELLGTGHTNRIEAEMSAGKLKVVGIAEPLRH